MRTWMLVVLALAAASGWPLAARGQLPEMESHVLWFRLLQNPGVAKELNLSYDQKIHIEGYADHFRKEHKKELDNLKKVENKEQREKLQELRRVIAEKAHKDIVKAAILKPEQEKRLRQILWQQRSPQALLDAEVEPTLKLTEEQKESLKTIFDDGAKKLRELLDKSQDKLDKEGRKKKAALHKDLVEKAQAVLTEEQKKAWMELKGEPFEVHFDPPPAPGPGPG